ncbi:CLUMA_CG007760, isoform A [Clunio marinus]|uniref:CLUMA_CG007760, isoform A n=1 Tax=Clunio marinus TaxID=568069 RepID=A0A1J1I1T0_9DIPT|nr:CLUMA_CG007760, isoform A [Clunio marinus]
MNEQVDSSMIFKLLFNTEVKWKDTKSYIECQPLRHQKSNTFQRHEIKKFLRTTLRLLEKLLQRECGSFE